MRRTEYDAQRHCNTIEIYCDGCRLMVPMEDRDLIRTTIDGRDFCTPCTFTELPNPLDHKPLVLGVDERMVMYQ